MGKDAADGRGLQKNSSLFGQAPHQHVGSAWPDLAKCLEAADEPSLVQLEELRAPAALVVLVRSTASSS